jgi:hypothetical protein
MKLFYKYINELINLNLNKIYYNKLNKYNLYRNNSKTNLYCENNSRKYKILREDNIFKMEHTLESNLEIIDEDISIYITINYIIIFKINNQTIEYYYIYYHSNNNIRELRYKFELNYILHKQNINSNINIKIYSILFNDTIYEKILNNVDNNVNILILKEESYDYLLNNNLIYEDNSLYNTSLDDTSLDDTSFDNSTVKDNTSFDNSTVKDNTSFDNTSFDTSFDNTSFDNSTVKDNTSFDNSTVKDNKINIKNLINKFNK